MATPSKRPARTGSAAVAGKGSGGAASAAQGRASVPSVAKAKDAAGRVQAATSSQAAKPAPKRAPAAEVAKSATPRGAAKGTGAGASAGKPRAAKTGAAKEAARRTATKDSRKGESAKTASRERALGPGDLKLRARLGEERDALLHQAEELEAERRALVEDPEAAEMRAAEDAEGAGLAAEREKDLSLSANAIDLLHKVERAIAKLEGGTYGRCERCAKPIAKARLNALPYAALCVTCQQAEERLLI